MSLNKLYISGLFLILLSGCSGGGGSSDSSFVETPANTQTVAGFVEDGPVAGGKVSLIDLGTGEVARRCWSSGVGRCETTTDDQGHFILHLSPETELADYQLVSEGGHDHSTGISYEDLGLDFSAPLAAFQNDQMQVNLSPLTTLLNELVQSGHSLDWSLRRVSTWAGLVSQDQLLAQPSKSYPLLKRTLLLVALMMQLEENGSTGSWSVLRNHLESGKSLIDSAGVPDQAELLASFQLSAEQATLLTDLSARLGAESVVAQGYNLFNRHLVAKALAEELDDYYAANDPAFSATDPDYLANRRALFAAISDAADSAIPLWNWTPQKILQHVLFKYQLTTFASLQGPTATLFTAGWTRHDGEETISLDTDQRIAEIASGHSQHLVSHNLADDELFDAGGNLRRVGYYYNSDISNLQRADDLARAVLDDQINDQLLVKLVEETAGSGMVRGWVSDDLFPTDLNLLIENRIQGSEFRGQAYLELAKEANKQGLHNEALEALASAEQYFDVVLTSKGTAFFADSDANNFRLLAFEYSRAGDFSAALRVLQFLHYSIALPLATPLAYNNAFAAGMVVFDDAVERGDFSFAAGIVDELRQIALTTPSDFSSSGTASYRTLVIHLVETARRYAVLGENQSALDLYYGAGMIADLRTNDGLLSGDGTYKNKTGRYTAAYMDEMAEALHQAGDAVGAFALLDTLSAVSKAKGYKVLASSIAMREAIDGGLLSPHPVEPPVENMNALDLVFYRVPTDTFNPTLLEAQIDALTYFVANRSAAYVAPTLIEHGYDDDAADALGRAADLVRMLDNNLAKPYGLGNSKIDFGFAKLAGLYIDIDQDPVARLLLVEAESQVLPYMTDVDLINKSLAAMADVYLRLGDPSSAGRLLAQASQAFSLDSYDVLVSALLRIHSSQTRQVIDDYVTQVKSLYLPHMMTDSELFVIIKHLVKASTYYSSIGRQDAALSTLALVLQPVMEIKSPVDKVDKMIDWAEGYAKIDEFSKALDTVQVIEAEGFSVSRNKAFLAIGSTYAGRKDFGENSGIDFVARIDLDKDGQPDFFHPLATDAEIQASGLVMDDDSDGDGIPDDQDARPMYFDNVQ